MVRIDAIIWRESQHEYFMKLQNVAFFFISTGLCFCLYLVFWIKYYNYIDNFVVIFSIIKERYEKLSTSIRQLII